VLMGKPKGSQRTGYTPTPESGREA
jgi:hypothetical protein